MISVVPAPAQLVVGEGSFPLAGASASGPLASSAAELLGVAVAPDGRVRLELTEGAHTEGKIAEGTLTDGTPTDVTNTAVTHPEGYRLEVSPDGVHLTADAEAGLFRGLQTLRQLATGGAIPAVTIVDAPRFAYRGAMLDIARHFFDADAVCRYLDAIALLKINHLHLHLTDDQGWRLEILSRPELTDRGATTQVGGGGGGYLTQTDYRRIVDHAARRFITIVPEIDMPGHTNAAIVADPTLGDSPTEPYEGIEVGFSSLAIRREGTYAFVADVLGELAALTPGPYLHLGGDESLSTSDEDFLHFIARATAIGAATGKTVIGWHEMGRSRDLPPGTIGQYWSFTTPQEGAAEHTMSFVEQGGRVILSPADVAYLDIKRTADDERGLTWSSPATNLRQSYEWEPGAVIPELAEERILGVEAPIWAETLETMEQVEEFAFPRLAAVAEIGWSAAGTSTAPGAFADFARRVAGLGRVMDAAGIRYWRTPEVDWTATSPSPGVPRP